MKQDPTRTKMLRFQYGRQLARLFRNFKRKTIPLLIWRIGEYQEKYHLHKRVTSKTLKHLGITKDVDEFLDIEINKHILEPSPEIIRKNIRHAYGNGRKKGQSQLEAYDIMAVSAITPLDWEALAELQDINFNLIKGCSEATKTAITRTCSEGVLKGWGTDKIAYELRRACDGNSNMGIVRAKMIARTEVINAYVKASDNTYKAAGLTEKEIIVVAAVDCCDICAGYDNRPVSEVGYPPYHPNCRCAIAPNPKGK